MAGEVQSFIHSPNGDRDEISEMNSEQISGHVSEPSSEHLSQDLPYDDSDGTALPGATGFLNQVRAIALKAASAHGCDLYDLEYVGTSSGRALRVYIDKDTNGGASIEDCANVSRAMNVELDTEDFGPDGNYHLEVSTPGLERVLKEPRHFEKALGKKIAVKSSTSLVEINPEFPELGLAKQATGKLLSLDQTGLKLEVIDKVSRKEVFIPFNSVTKAHVVFEFVDSSKPKGKPGKGPKKRPESKFKS